MGTNGEYYADGVPRCNKCGSANIIVELTTYLFINREEEEGELIITSEWEDGTDHDEKLICKDCKEEL